MTLEHMVRVACGAEFDGDVMLRLRPAVGGRPNPQLRVLRRGEEGLRTPKGRGQARHTRLRPAGGAPIAHHREAPHRRPVALRPASGPIPNQQEEGEHPQHQRHDDQQPAGAKWIVMSPRRQHTISIGASGETITSAAPILAVRHTSRHDPRAFAPSLRHARLESPPGRQRAGLGRRGTLGTIPHLWWVSLGESGSHGRDAPRADRARSPIMRGNGGSEASQWHGEQRRQRRAARSSPVEGGRP
jgi:hypothetical protein